MATNEVTLAQLITRSRRRADQENSEFCTDAEVVDYINDAVAELHEMMVNEYELYYLSSYTYTLPADNPKALPDSFWKALGCDFASGGVTRRIRRYMFQERNAFESPLLKQGYMGNVFFIIEGNNIRFIPESPPAGTVTLWYIPEPQKFDSVSPSLGRLNSDAIATKVTLSTPADIVNFSNGSSITFASDVSGSTSPVTTAISSVESDPASGDYGTFNVESTVGIESQDYCFTSATGTKLSAIDKALANGFERFIILDAAIKMLQKEESDTQILVAEREGVRHRLMLAAKDRTPGESRAIADVKVGTGVRDYINWI